jgi:hypothetical protein
MSGGGSVCDLIIQWVLTGAVSPAFAIAEFPHCAPFVDPGGRWWWAD